MFSVVEIVGPRWRPHVNAMYGYFWSIGGLLMCLCAYLIHNWRYLQLVLSAQMLFMLAYFWLASSTSLAKSSFSLHEYSYYRLPESPRWLLTKGRVDEAMKIFTRIAKSNKTTLNPDKVVKLLFTSKFEWYVEISHEIHCKTQYLVSVFRSISCLTMKRAPLA